MHINYCFLVNKIEYSWPIMTVLILIMMSQLDICSKRFKRATLNLDDMPRDILLEIIDSPAMFEDMKITKKVTLQLGDWKKVFSYNCTILSTFPHVWKGIQEEILDVIRYKRTVSREWYRNNGGVLSHGSIKVKRTEIGMYGVEVKMDEYTHCGIYRVCLDVSEGNFWLSERILRDDVYYEIDGFDNGDNLTIEKRTPDIVLEMEIDYDGTIISSKGEKFVPIRPTRLCSLRTMHSLIYQEVFTKLAHKGFEVFLQEDQTLILTDRYYAASNDFRSHNILIGIIRGNDKSWHWCSIQKSAIKKSKPSLCVQIGIFDILQPAPISLTTFINSSIHYLNR